MKVKLIGVSKKYGSRWIFQNINHTVEENTGLAICGRNGAGKTTLLKAIAGFNTPTRGSVQYYSEEKPIEAERAVRHMSYAGPDQNLIEEFTLREQLDFHFRFKEASIEKSEMVRRSGLSGTEDQYIHDFSSGMKQRLKLLLALFSRNKMLLLDEPTSFMDEQGVAWFKSEMEACKGRFTVIVASNQPHEYALAQARIDLKSTENQSHILPKTGDDHNG